MMISNKMMTIAVTERVTFSLPPTSRLMSWVRAAMSLSSGPDRVLTAAAVLTCVAALLIPFETPEERRIYLPMLGAFSFGLTGLTGEKGAAWVVAMGAAAAWIGLGGWVYHEYHDDVVRFYRSPWAVLRPRTWWGWMLFVVAIKFVLAALAFCLTLALPVTLRVVARYLSANAAWLAIGLAVGVSLLAGSDKAAAASLLALVLAAAALMGLQALAERLSGRLFRRAPVTFFQHDD